MAQSQFSPSTRFDSSPLVRLLASLDITPASDSTQTFAEKLSHWVAWTDAIALSRVLADGQTRAAAATDAATGVRKAITQVQRVRQDLVDAIARDALLQDDRATPNAPPAAQPQPGTGGKIDYSAYRRQYRAHQHAMEDRIARLRVGVRAAIAAVSPSLGRLAALDAVLDDALSAHQRRLLDTVPLMLEKHFKTLYTADAEKPDPRTASAGPAPRRASLAVGPAWQRVLRAELETRLQPVQGMLDALGHETAAAT